ncbi:hypothetical protein Tco_0812190 [Tanacetum coccineum]
MQQEDTAYPCLDFPDNHNGLKSYTLYLGTSIHRIQGLLYMKILEDINRGPYSKKSPKRCIPHRSIRHKGAKKVRKEPQDHRKTLVIFTQPNTCSVKVKMENLNITMEEYIRFEEEKARRRGKVYNGETATYDKIWIMKTFTTSDLLKLNSEL